MKTLSEIVVVSAYNEELSAMQYLVKRSDGTSLPCGTGPSIVGLWFEHYTDAEDACVKLRMRDLVASGELMSDKAQDKMGSP